ncbi:hypothetical protein F5J12DRAFT_861877 [Pisolithus orientalis]|uniref:uncharacterized protein n=1 Tax=Pisolithus orientalis TaxID=936130 RepID=UPI00222474FA|nr:uncharacterized protein F5J12DRAFT_861877 [Pisolithus orientalis]KAI5991053.1 hypothetical protein F5J12DRAFT_861877 [Pisolithus orientalis]
MRMSGFQMCACTDSKYHHCHLCALQGSHWHCVCCGEMRPNNLEAICLILGDAMHVPLGVICHLFQHSRHDQFLRGVSWCPIFGFTWSQIFDTPLTISLSVIEQLKNVMSSLTPAVDNSTHYEVSDSDDIQISSTQYLFAPDVKISMTCVEVGMRLYVVVQPTHLTLVNIHTEDDLQDIIHVLLVLATCFPVVGTSTSHTSA